ncbi:MAG: hypothetical protein FJ023_08735 [Chloroflexi bacterium]|nr:hypothetical protein [Chloroflexota bacterium]
MRKPLRVLPVTLILLLVLALTVSVNAQDDFEVTDLIISPNSVAVGEPVTITAKITNTKDTEATFPIELKLNGEVKDSQELTLNAGQSDNVSFTITADKPGDNLVELGDASNVFTVTGQASFWTIFEPWVLWTIGAIIVVLIILVIAIIAMPSRKKQPSAAIKGMQGMQGPPGTQATMPIPTPMSGPGSASPPIGHPTAMPTQTPGAFPMPEQFQMPRTVSTPGPFPAPGPMAGPYQQYAGRPVFSVSNLTITPNQVRAGEQITISAIVYNNGAEASTYSVVLRINGMVENIIDLTLSPGASQVTTFMVTKDTGGDYYAEIDGWGGAFTVIPLVPATFSVSNLVIVPDRVKQGEDVVISAIVTNNGELAGTYSMTLKLKDSVESTEEVDLNPGESRKVAFKINKSAPGFYNVELEGLTGRFVVEMEWQR